MTTPTSFPVKIKHSGGELEVLVEPELTVSGLKDRIADKLGSGVSPNRLRLIVLGRVMTDNSTVSSYHIEPRHTIHMLIKEPEAAAPASESQQAPRPQPVPEGTLPRSASNPFAGGFDDAAAAGGLPPGGAFGGIDLGGVFRGLLSNVGAVAGAINVAQLQRTAAATAATAAASTTGTTTATTGDAAPAAGAADAAPRPATQTIPIAMTAPPMHAFGPPPHPFGPLAAVHVHLHVTLAELEEVPDRIQRLQQRIAANQPAAPAFTQIHIQTHNGPIDLATLAAHGAHHPVPATSRPQAPQQPAPPRSLATLLAAMDPAASAPLRGTSILTVLRRSLENVGMPEAMQLMAGNWSVADRCRQPLRDYVRERTGGSRDLVQELVEEAVVDAMAKIDGEPQVERMLVERTRPGVDAHKLIRGALRSLFRALIALTDDAAPVAVSAFPQAVRRLLVVGVGHSTSYFERHVARNGPSDVDAIVNAIIGLATTEAFRSRPDLAPFAGMVLPMLAGTLRQWRAEYETSLKSANDDEVLQRNAAIVQVCSTRPVGEPSPPPAAAAPAPRPAAAAATAAGGVNADSGDQLDNLLDACLDETAPSAAGARPAETAAASSGSSVARLLRGDQVSAIPSELRRELAAMADEDARAPVVPPSGSYAALFPSQASHGL